MWYFITAVIAAVIGFGAFALFAINGENKEIQRLTSIHKMLEQVLKNQLDMMEWGCRNVERERKNETEALLEQVKP